MAKLVSLANWGILQDMRIRLSQQLRVLPADWSARCACRNPEGTVPGICAGRPSPAALAHLADGVLPFWLSFYAVHARKSQGTVAVAKALSWLPLPVQLLHT